MELRIKLRNENTMFREYDELKSVINFRQKFVIYINKL